MLNGSRVTKILITEDLVRHALDSIIQSADESPLEYLLCVENHITHHEIVRVGYSRRMALQDILTEFIENNIRHRLFLKNTGVSFGVQAAHNQDDINAIIYIAVKEGDSILLGLLWMYCRYIRIEFNLQRVEFARLVGIDDRTLRRYHRQAIQVITDHLVRHEMACWQQYKQTALLYNLPNRGRVIQIDRESEHKVALEMLEKCSPSHLLVRGDRGIGKSTFAENLVVTLIEKQMVEKVIWISNPDSVEAIHDTIAQEVLVPGMHRPMLPLPQMHKLIIVIDGIEKLSASDMAELLKELQDFQLIITSNHPLPEWRFCSICLDPLSHEDVLIYLDYLKSQFFNSYTDDVLTILRLEWPKVGGNPLGLRNLLVNLSTSSIQDAFSETGNELYEQLLAGYSISDLMSGYIKAIFPEISWDIDLTLGSPMTSSMSWNSFAQLTPSVTLDRKLDFTSTSIYIKLLTQILIQSPESWSQVQLVIEYLLASQYKEKNIYALVTLIENTLSFARNVENDAWYSDLVKRTWPLAVKVGRWAQWVTIIKHAMLFQSNSDELILGLAVCMRHLHKREVEDLLLSLIWNCGQNGKFGTQSEARLQYAMFLRGNGFYDQAKQIIIHLRVNKSSGFSLDFNKRLELELIFLLIEMGHVEEARQTLAHLNEQDARVLMLRLELASLMNQRDEVRQLARVILADSSIGNTTLARVHIMLGSIEHKRSPALALEHLTLAYTLLCRSREHSIYQIRVLSNIGGILLTLGRLEEANEILSEVNLIQTQVGDRVGLAASEYNLRGLIKNWLFDKTAS
jgi:hypothetical protein